MRDSIRAHPFRWFYAFAFGIASLLWTYAVVAEIVAPDAYGPGQSLVDHYFTVRAEVLAAHPLIAAHPDGVPATLLSYWAVPLVFPFLFFPGAPTTAALIVVAAGWGKSGLKTLLSLYHPLRGSLGWREGARLYLTLLLLVAGVAALAGTVTWLRAGDLALPGLIRGFGLQSAAMFTSAWLVALFANQGALLEELGWRGFAWPLLVRKFGAPLVAAVVLGVCWALWHFPREVPLLLAGQNTPPRLLAGQSVFIASCVGMTIVAGYFVNLSGGSVWPAIIVHGSFNMIGSAMRIELPGAGGSGQVHISLMVLWIILAGAVLLVAGRDLGWQRRMALHGGDGNTDPSRLWSKEGSN